MMDPSDDLEPMVPDAMPNARWRPEPAEAEAQAAASD